MSHTKGDYRLRLGQSGSTKHGTGYDLMWYPNRFKSRQDSHYRLLLVELRYLQRRVTFDFLADIGWDWDWDWVLMNDKFLLSEFSGPHQYCPLLYSFLFRTTKAGTGSMDLICLHMPRNNFGGTWSSKICPLYCTPYSNLSSILLLFIYER